MEKIMELCNKNLDIQKEFEHNHDWQNNLHFPKLNSIYYLLRHEAQ
jgi:hypothetical protein